MRRKEKKKGKNNSNITKPGTTQHKSKTNQQQEAVQQKTTENDLAFRWSFLSRTSSFPSTNVACFLCDEKILCSQAGITQSFTCRHHGYCEFFGGRPGFVVVFCYVTNWFLLWDTSDCQQRLPTEPWFFAYNKSRLSL
jgi:hypothetical protein